MNSTAQALIRLNVSLNEKRIDALLERADLLVSRDNERALACVYEAYDLARSLSDENRLANSLLHRGRIEYYLAEYDHAENTLITALDFFVRHKDAEGQSRCLLNLGLTRLVKGAYAQSLENFFAALPLLQTLGRRREEGRCAMHIGTVYSFLDDYATCVDYYLQALNIAQTNGDVEESIVVNNNIGDCLQRLERFDESLEFYQRALQIASDLNAQRLENTALINIGELFARLKQFEKSKHFLMKGLNLARELRNYSEEIRAFGVLIQIYSIIPGSSEEIKRIYDEGVKLSQTYNLQHGELILHLNFASHLCRQKEYATALEAAFKSLEISIKAGLQTEIARAHEVLQSIYSEKGDFEAAYNHLRQYYELKRNLLGDKQIKRIEAVIIKSEIEKTKEIAAVQKKLNEQLAESNQKLEITNAELVNTYEQNQELLVKMQFQANHDHLTSLPNRSLFEDRLAQTLAQAARNRQIFAVMYLDLDGFKMVNDTLGHNAGDELLIEIAVRLRSVVRESDTIARLGGDEFALIITNLKENNDVKIIAQKLLSAIKTKFIFDKQEFTVGASIGICFYPTDGDHPEILLKRADQTMYWMKQNGKNDYAFYTDYFAAKTRDAQQKRQTLGGNQGF